MSGKGRAKRNPQDEKIAFLVSLGDATPEEALRALVNNSGNLERAITQLYPDQDVDPDKNNKTTRNGHDRNKRGTCVPRIVCPSHDIH